MLYRENGQFKTSYRADAQIFPIAQDRLAIGALLVFAYAIAPFVVSEYAFRAIVRSQPRAESPQRSRRESSPSHLREVDDDGETMPQAHPVPCADATLGIGPQKNPLVAEGTFQMVDLTGLEPVTFSMSTKRSNQLS